jgi:8-oxo-dGTP diphosphatase
MTPRPSSALSSSARCQRANSSCARSLGWEPPGGQVERGEDLLTALQREIAEESGCQVEVGRLAGVYSNTGPLGIVMFTFLCTHTGGEPCAGHECLDAGWFTPDEALRLVTHPAQAAKLRDALVAEDTSGVLYRAYRTTPVGEGDQQRYVGNEEVSERRC